MKFDDMYRKLLLIMLGMALTTALHANSVYNVRDYGAKGDGFTLDHTAINKAIDACVAGGGGQVYIPAGTYLCGSIHLKSHVELHLSFGATILPVPYSWSCLPEGPT